MAINSVLQVLIDALLGTFYLQILPGWLGLDSQIVRLKGRRWYEQRFLPRISPLALYGLLFTIVVMFALQGEAITSDPVQVIKVAIPLLLYFVLMWSIAFALGKQSGLDYARISALAGVIGPLIEVPVLVSLVYVSLWLRGQFRVDQNIRWEQC